MMVDSKGGVGGPVKQYFLPLEEAEWRHVVLLLARDEPENSEALDILYGWWEARVDGVRSEDNDASPVDVHDNPGSEDRDDNGNVRRDRAHDIARQLARKAILGKRSSKRARGKRRRRA